MTTTPDKATMAERDKHRPIQVQCIGVLIQQATCCNDADALEAAYKVWDYAGQPACGNWMQAEDTNGKETICEKRELAALSRPAPTSEKLVAITPHDYAPSALHMGDCSICGHIQDSPIHKKPVANDTAGADLSNMTVEEEALMQLSPRNRPAPAAEVTGELATIEVEAALKGDVKASAEQWQAASMFLFWPCNMIDLAGHPYKHPTLVAELAKFIARREARANPSPDAGRVPEGFQLVPKTLSAEMLAAFDRYNDSHVAGAWTFQECWDEVLAVSPVHDEVKS